MKPLDGGDLAVVLWNRGTCGTHRQLAVSWSALGLPAGQKIQFDGFGSLGFIFIQDHE